MPGRPHCPVSFGLALLLAGGPAWSRPRPRPGQPWSSFQECLDAVRRETAGSEHLVPSAALAYPARRPLYDAAGYPVPDAQGQPATATANLTGRVFFPPAWRLPRGAAVPLVVYPHGTELRKEAVPSRFGGQEWAVGAAAAAWYGFPVGREGDGISHAAAAWVALPSAFGWFRDGMPVPGTAMVTDGWTRASDRVPVTGPPADRTAR